MYLGSEAAITGALKCLQVLQNCVKALLMIWHDANNRFCLDGSMRTCLCNMPERVLFGQVNYSDLILTEV